MAQKAVLKLDVHDEKDKKKAMKIVSGFAGIDSISMSMKDGKLTVTGAFDPVHLVEKLRKVFDTHIESVGPAKDEKKASGQSKNSDSKNGGKDQNDDKIGVTLDPFHTHLYINYPPRLPTSLYDDNHRSIEEDPNGCTIC